jgi:hypothetical protein
VIRRNYYIDKRCTKMGGSKNVKEPNEKKRFSIIYQKTKVQKVGSPKNELAKPKTISLSSMSCLTWLVVATFGALTT